MVVVPEIGVVSTLFSRLPSFSRTDNVNTLQSHRHGFMPTFGVAVGRLAEGVLVFQVQVFVV